MAIRERISLYNRYRDRRVHQVEPFRTYYIIMEGTKTEPLYFHYLDRYLAEKRVRNNIKIIYLDRTSNDRGRNTPRQLFTFLNNCRKINNQENAVYCMVFDRDSYKGFSDPTNSYLDFINKVKMTSVKMIVTSPCFEIWLLLHHKGVISEYIRPHYQQIFNNNRLNSTFTYISKMVYELFGFNPKTTIPEDFVEKADIAMKQAAFLTSDLVKLATEIGENVSDFIKELCIDPRNLE
ncbi:MAG: RloB family protein [Bacilli bacterium]|nr:RloB family protein [Bacilli bacterium]MDD4077383.1 RloB family protein [Bacilli bacterium]MDD4388388.1 RloB family protein [Bacilli bacterium]